MAVITRKVANLILPKNYLRPELGLVIVDPQFRPKDMERMNSPVTPKDGLFRKKFQNICALAEAAHSSGKPIVILKATFNPDELVGEVVAKAGANATIIGKDEVDGFDGTALERSLDAAGVKTFVLAGFHTAACLYATAISGVEKGYKVATSLGVIIGGRDDGVGPQPEDPDCSPEDNLRLMAKTVEAKKFYMEKTILLPAVDDLIALLRNGKN